MPRPLRTRKQVPAVTAATSPPQKTSQSAASSSSAKPSSSKPAAKPSTRARSTTAAASTTESEVPASPPAATRRTRSSQAPKSPVPAAAQTKSNAKGKAKAGAAAKGKGKGKGQATRRDGSPAASSATPKPAAAATATKSPSPSPPPASSSRSRIPETPPRQLSLSRHSSISGTPASSNAENRTPAREFGSSPPVAVSTPKHGPRQRETLIVDFRSDAGYTPPPPRRPSANSAERPRLQDLEPTTLEPLPGDDDLPGPGSPTPRRNDRRGSAIVFEDDEVLEDEDAALPTGKGFLVPGDEDPFIIYSDPKSPAGSPPPQALPPPVTGTQAPPLSSSPPRKRRSSEAGFDLESPVPGYHHPHHHSEPEDGADEKGKRRKTHKKTKSAEALPTAELLRDLMPRRRRHRKNRGSKKDDLEFPSSSVGDDEMDQDQDLDEEEGESEDELARPATRAAGKAKGRAPRTPAGKSTRSKSTESPKVAKKPLPPSTIATGKAAKKTKEAWSRPLHASARKPTAASSNLRTYSRKAPEPSPEAHDAHEDGMKGVETAGAAGGEGGDESSELTPLESETETETQETLELADGIVERDGRRKLRALAEKFRVVDKWALEFEDVSQGSLAGERSSDSGKR